MLVGLAMTAADFHRQVALGWLMRGASAADGPSVAIWAVQHRVADAVLTPVEVG
jgi:hypothetical protein